MQFDVHPRRLLPDSKALKPGGQKMQRTRRQVLHVAAGAATLQAFSRFASAQDWPTRPVTMVVTYAAGSSNDVLGRILAPFLSESLGQQVIIENVGGAGGMNGAARVAKAAADGYQFVVGGTGTFGANQSLYKKPLYNPIADFAPVVLIDEQPLVLVVRKDFPANSLQEFIAYAAANEGKMQYGSAGVGSGSHLGCLLFNAASGIDGAHIPYRAAVLALQDLIGGRIDYACPLISTALPQTESGGVKAMAIFAKDRSPMLPNLPTAHEQGLSSFELYYWDALFLPKATPASIVQRLHDATVAAMNMPSVQERLKTLGATLVAPERRSQEYLRTFVESEIDKWGRVIKAAGVRMD